MNHLSLKERLGERSGEQVSLGELAARGAYTDMATLVRLRFAAKDLRLPARHDSRASLAGGARTRFRGRGMEFEEVRVYQPGDDIRTIDWRVTARTHVPHTKLFREERERPTFIAADQRANLFFGSQRCFKSVLCAQLASLLAWASLNNNDRVGGLVFGNRDHRDIRPRRARHSALELIQRLHEYNHRLTSPLVRERHLPLATVLKDIRRIARPGSAVYLISDFQDFDLACQEQLYLLARHTEVTLFLVVDPLERDLPATGLLTVSDGQQRLQIAAGDPRLREKYRAHYQQRHAQLNKLSMPLYSFSTADDEITQLRQSFHRNLSRSGRYQ